jgi:hypothetical protein
MLRTVCDLALLCHPVLAFLTMSQPKMQTRNPTLQYFLFSFFSILALRYMSSMYFVHAVEGVADVCRTYDQPNPIVSLYPNNATGTLNGTVAVIPISLQLARQLIPSQYGILEHAYRNLLPSFPVGMYPAVLQAVHDHEVQAFGFKIPDFSVSCTSEWYRTNTDPNSALASNSPSSTYSATTPHPSNGPQPCS